MSNKLQGEFKEIADEMNEFGSRMEKKVQSLMLEFIKMVSNLDFSIEEILISDNNETMDYKIVDEFEVSLDGAKVSIDYMTFSLSKDIKDLRGNIQLYSEEFDNSWDFEYLNYLEAYDVLENYVEYFTKNVLKDKIRKNLIKKVNESNIIKFKDFENE